MAILASKIGALKSAIDSTASAASILDNVNMDKMEIQDLKSAATQLTTAAGDLQRIIGMLQFERQEK